MLEDLLNNNKLKYIFIRNGQNIVKEMTLSRNIKNLNFFCIDNVNNRVNITLDITNEYPDKLSAFKIVYDYNYSSETCKYSGVI